MSKSTIILLALFPFLAGCAIDKMLAPKPDMSQFYYLKVNEIVAFEDAADQTAIMIGSTSISKLLDFQQILTFRSDNQLSYSQNHVWGEKLDDGISKVMKSVLTNKLGTHQVGIAGKTANVEADYEIGYFVEELGGELGGNVRLRALWWIKNGDEKRMRTFERSAQSADSSYSSYVDAIRSLIGQWSEDVAAHIDQS
jgi:uncharacterized lipoprotein YmbA